MTTALTLPIARLRAAGCRVSTVIGHDPNIGDWIYSIRVPDSIGDMRTGNRPTVRVGWASASVPRHSDGHHIVVKACAYRKGIRTPDDVKAEYLRSVADLMTAVADTVDQRTNA